MREQSSTIATFPKLDKGIKWHPETLIFRPQNQRSHFVISSKKLLIFEDTNFPTKERNNLSSTMASVNSSQMPDFHNPQIQTITSYFIILTIANLSVSQCQLCLQFIASPPAHHSCHLRSIPRCLHLCQILHHQLRRVTPCFQTSSDPPAASTTSARQAMPCSVRFSS